ncbi:pyridoxal phosphate-dependent aminotransferase [Membranihabitans marinus]|uniref:pyridoxal phosphate-dependent aminotransferase n=1 Tax=Membranihabitans marinus TaxID=1227546 RepID=UPI001F0068F6|nr:aminotransferase class I/II-fold pyridoxal phosphate-dependent enzyme [Membranihabitans marinus]
MTIKSAHRIDSVVEYYFSKKLKEIAQLKSEGKEIINLGIGSPDLPPHQSVIRALTDGAENSQNHGYQSYIGIPELRAAYANWYANQYQVDLNSQTEILPLIGSKEGIMHISMTFLESGDEVLIPDPGYPTYRSAALLAGATIRNYSLISENGWQPNFTELESTDLSKVKIMWVNYPHMPTGAKASIELFEKLVEFGQRHNILICHDNPYSLILNPEPLSILSVAGAKDHCIELNSLSKSHNMAGWRMGVMVGKQEYISEILKFKSNMDSGMFRPMQLAAIQALSLDGQWYQDNNKIYEERKNIAYRILDQLGCSYETDQAGLFTWGRIPSSYRSGFDLSDDILDHTGVFITPGGIFGDNGNAYIRISICTDAKVLNQALEKIESFVNQSVL